MDATQTTLIDPLYVQGPRGVKWVLLGRLMSIIFCIALFAILSLARTESSFSPIRVYVLLIAFGFLCGGFLFVLPLWRWSQASFLILQFLADSCMVTGLVFLTGGVQSNFVNLYFVLIMVSSLLLSRRVSGLFASLATMGLAAVTVLYLTGTGLSWVEVIYRPAESIEIQTIWMRMLLTVVAFFVVAYLSGLLADRLEQARTLNEEILQNMAEGVVVFDSSNAVSFVNNEFQTLFADGHPIQLGESVEDVFPHPDDRVLRQLIQSHTCARFELPVREDEADPRAPVEVRTSILGISERTRGMILLAIDLSLRERAEQAERRADRFSAVSEMAAGLAHEIRNPLASVRGSIQEISRDFEDGSADRKLADIVIKESDRLDRIITNFLQYARQRPLKASNCRLGDVLEDVRLLLQSRPDATNIRIELERMEEPWVRCDADLLRDVFLNFGVNAIAAMQGEGVLRIACPDKSIKPPGTVVLRKGCSGVTITFSDTGGGLQPGTEEKVFEPFYTTKARGSGLGLSIARRVVESHDGIVWMENSPGEGATFCCWLPLNGPFTRGAPVLPTALPDDGVTS